MENTHDFKLIDRDTLKAKLDKREKFHLWNVLGPKYYKPEENIPGSKNVPEEKLEELLPALHVGKEEPIVVYCAGGQCTASVKAAQKLTGLGYKNVWAYEGGTKEWKEAGFPLSTSTPA